MQEVTWTHEESRSRPDVLQSMDVTTYNIPKIAAIVHGIIEVKCNIGMYNIWDVWYE